MKMKWIAVLFLCLLASFNREILQGALADRSSDNVSEGLYSTLHNEDVRGPEGIAIVLLLGEGQWFMTIKCAGGVPFFRKLSIDVNGRFTFPTESDSNCGTGSYRGKVDALHNIIELQSDAILSPIKKLPLLKAID